MQFILDNWEIIGLILSNITALFVTPPHKMRSK